MRLCRRESTRTLLTYQHRGTFKHTIPVCPVKSNGNGRIILQGAGTAEIAKRAVLFRDRERVQRFINRCCDPSPIIQIDIHLKNVSPHSNQRYILRTGGPSTYFFTCLIGKPAPNQTCLHIELAKRSIITRQAITTALITFSAILTSQFIALINFTLRTRKPGQASAFSFPALSPIEAFDLFARISTAQIDERQQHRKENQVKQLVHCNSDWGMKVPNSTGTSKFPRQESKWGKVEDPPHPTLPHEEAYFFDGCRPPHKAKSFCVPSGQLNIFGLSKRVPEFQPNQNI